MLVLLECVCDHVLGNSIFYGHKETHLNPITFLGYGFVWDLFILLKLRTFC